MKASIIFTLVHITTALEFIKEWELWKKDFNKTYVTEGVELHRYAVWKANKKYVDEHNSKPGFRLEMNKFADLNKHCSKLKLLFLQDTKEFSMMYKGYKPGKPEDSKATPVYFTETELPAAVDWRTKGYVTPVKWQEYLTTQDRLIFYYKISYLLLESIEGQHFNATGNLVSLSVQNVLDCCLSGAASCRGGWPQWAMEYVISNGGVDTEASYPYVAHDEKCMYNSSNIGSNCTSYNEVMPAGSEPSLKAAVATIGPISVCIDASRSSFQLYQSGVYDDPYCSEYDTDHCVLAVGYGATSSGVDYWIVKNSWGTDWGMQGYIWMSRNKHDQCGIANTASYPTVTA
eukprot:Em0007g1590a